MCLIVLLSNVDNKGFNPAIQPIYPGSIRIPYQFLASNSNPHRKFFIKRQTSLKMGSKYRLDI
jgi:hypothetical protein